MHDFGSSKWAFPKLIAMHHWSWFALKQQGMSEHLVWILPCFYYGQATVIKEHDVDEMENLDLDLRDGGRSLLNFKFANGIIIIGTNYHVIGVLVGKLVEHPAVVGITAECAGNKSPHNAGPTTVAMANAEWIDHINSLQGIKPQVAFITNHTMYM